MLIPRRFIWSIAVTAYCAVALAGCKTVPNTTKIHETTVKDLTTDPAAALKMLKELSATKEELASLLDAYDGLWHTNVDVEERQSKLQAELRQKEHEAQAATDRAAEAARAQEKLDRTWMFTLIGVGVASMLAGGALAWFGGMKYAKLGLIVGVIGAGFIVMAPNARSLEGPMRLLVMIVFGSMALMLVSWAANNIWYDWRAKGTEE